MNAKRRHRRRYRARRTFRRHLRVGIDWATGPDITVVASSAGHTWVDYPNFLHWLETGIGNPFEVEVKP